MMRARTLCAKANAAMPDDPAYVGYLEELFGRKLDDVRILTPFICDFGNRVKFGKGVFINHSAILSASGGIEFEDGSMAAPGLRIATINHHRGEKPSGFHDLLLSVRHPRLARISLRSDAGRCNLRPNHTQLAHHHHQGRFHEEAQRGHRLSIGRAARNPSGRPAQFWWPGRASEAERLPHHPHGEDAPSPRNACTTISGLTAPTCRNTQFFIILLS